MFFKKKTHLQTGSAAFAAQGAIVAKGLLMGPQGLRTAADKESMKTNSKMQQILFWGIWWNSKSVLTC